MSLSMRSPTSPTSPTKHRIQSTRLPKGPVIRMFLLAALGVVGCVWALVHHYTTKLPSMYRPLPSASAPGSSDPAPSWDPGEIPAPTVEHAE